MVLEAILAQKGVALNDGSRGTLPRDEPSCRVTVHVRVLGQHAWLYVQRPARSFLKNSLIAAPSTDLCYVDVSKPQVLLRAWLVQTLCGSSGFVYELTGVCGSFFFLHMHGTSSQRRGWSASNCRCASRG